MILVENATNSLNKKISKEKSAISITGKKYKRNLVKDMCVIVDNVQ